ncbi:tubulin polyglutamylase complex subunit 1-like [Montipora foliosa]|uniref:tubulin polyglutamylase complex subunit 1-like n=1 Tax=Montipora foliosa TaxID=591990 RepID=UPI0035F16E45
MAEKKVSKTNVLEELKADKTESPLDFLSRTGVTSQIKDAVTLVIENRPEDPIAFLAEFFDNHASNATALMRAHQKLILVHHSQPSFQNNLVLAYNILHHQKNNGGLRGLTGKTYNDLLAMLCRDLSFTEAEPLKKQIMCFSHEVVRFPVFRLGVLSTFVYQDFLKQAESLYNELDLSERGKADRRLCEVILCELKQAVTKTTDDPVSVIQVGSMLSSQRLNKVMIEALVKSGATSQTMTVDEFVVSAAEVLLEQIPDFR